MIMQLVKLFNCYKNLTEKFSVTCPISSDLTQNDYHLFLQIMKLFGLQHLENDDELTPLQRLNKKYFEMI